MICTSESFNAKTQYPFSIIYLPTQLEMDIVYRKTGFKCEFSRFLMYTNKKSSDLFRKKKAFNIYMFFFWKKNRNVLCTLNRCRQSY